MGWSRERVARSFWIASPVPPSVLADLPEPIWHVLRHPTQILTEQAPRLLKDVCRCLCVPQQATGRQKSQLLGIVLSRDSARDLAVLLMRFLRLSLFPPLSSRQPAIMQEGSGGHSHIMASRTNARSPGSPHGAPPFCHLLPQVLPPPLQGSSQSSPRILLSL
jgi:hypothetical protein